MFITFEGGEGTGKTTMIKRITAELSGHHKVISTREPGGSVITEAIRDIILNPKYDGISPTTEALLLAASRAQHLEDVIIPALDAGKIVLCDRYLDSSLAYQGHARGLGYPFILSINSKATEHMPDLTFYIDLNPEVGINRISKRIKYDRLDREKQAFHASVREGYLEVADMYPERIRVIDGNRPLEVLIDEVLGHIKDAL